MLFYWLRLYPEQALHLDSPQRIAGRTVRGALAAVTLRTCVPGALHDLGACGPTCAYWPLFGGAGAPLRFGDALATRDDAVAPFPVTARTCRNHPGFATAGGHGIFDIAIRAWVFESALDQPARLLVPFEARCPVCGATLINGAGMLVRRGGRDYATLADLTLPVSTSHQPIDRATRRTLPAFTQTGSVLARSAYYAARLDVPDALDAPLRRALSAGLVAGGRRTRGMGALRAELVPRPDPSATLHDRVGMFNRALRAETRFYAAMAGGSTAVDEGEWYFLLDFRLPLTLTSQPNPLADLRMLRSATVLRQWLSAETRGGRTTATGLPATVSQWRIGTALCRVPPDEDRGALERALAYLETHGGGADRVYSQFSVCDPFHLEIEPL